MVTASCRTRLPANAHHPTLRTHGARSERVARDMRNPSRHMRGPLQSPKLDRRGFTPDFGAGMEMRVELLPARGRTQPISVCQTSERSVVVDFRSAGSLM